MPAAPTPREFVTEPGPLADLPIPAVFGHRPAAAPAMPAATGTEALVCADIARRQAHGLAKYGTSVAANPLELRAWLVHLYEELLDAAVYTRRAIAELDAAAQTSAPSPFPSERRS